MTINRNIDDFTASYIECALWSSVDAEGDPLDEFHDIDGIAESCLLSMIADCAKFQADNRLTLAASGLDAGQQGHDFWLTRNHHGAGFWDRKLGQIGDILTAAAHSFGECGLYIGDDWKIHCE